MEKGRSSSGRSRRVISYKGISRVFIIKEFYKLGRSLFIVSFVFVIKRFSRISFFLRNVKVNFIVKIVVSLFDKDVNILIEIVERNSMEIVIEIVESG